MFKRKVVAGITIWLALIAGAFWRFHAIDPHDQEVYHQLMANSDKSRVSSSSTNQQQRFHVVKDLLFAETPHRLHCHLCSDSSELTFEQNNRHIELVECFKEMTCLIQEDLFYECQDGRLIKVEKDGKELNQQADARPKQIVRYLKAKNATYHYQTKELVAENVDVARYCLFGHDTVYSLEGFQPFMVGKAERIQLSLAKDRQSFQAQGFQATIHPSWMGGT